MHAVRDEIEQEILGGHVDSAFLVDDRRLALEVFNGRRIFLTICADPADSRVYLTPDRVRARTDAVTPFLLLMRKYVRGSRLSSIDQPRLERLYCLRFRSRPADGLPREVAMYVEAMGRRSNIILVDEDGAIMDALFRAPPSANPTRPVLPHLRYEPPPRPLKLGANNPGLPSILARLSGQHRGTAAALLVAQIDGLSPLAAREVLARSGHDPDVTAGTLSDWTPVVAEIRQIFSLVDSGGWQPTIAWRDQAPIAFAPYPLRQFSDADIRTYPTMSEIVALAGGPQIRAAPLDRLRRPLLDALATRIEAALRKRSSLERSLAAADRADALRQAGEAILASLHRIEPGTVALDWNGTRIDLYPSLSPKENAQAYFRQYTAARNAKSSVPPMLEAVNAELEYLGEMIVHVEMARSEAEIAHLRRELDAQGVGHFDRGKTPPRPKRPKDPRPAGVFRRIPLDDGEILLGASAQGNEHVTFKLAGPDDLWFHARGVPGAHIILKARRADPPKASIELAARLAAQNCAMRLDGRVDVDYTRRKYVRKIPGAAPGRVTYRQESTLAIDLANADDPTRPVLRGGTA